MIRIYIDTSALKRPFDDISTPKIALESAAVLSIIGAVEKGILSIVDSETLQHENDKNPLTIRREWARRFLGLADLRVKADEVVGRRARSLEKNGLAPMDALHVSTAESAGCDVLITCDDRLIRKSSVINIPVMNPVEFVHNGMRVQT